MQNRSAVKNPRVRSTRLLILRGDGVNVDKQRKRAAKTELQWAAQARRDAKYNRAQAKRDTTMGNFTLARFHNREAKWDLWWSNRRVRLAKRYNQSLR